MPNTNWPSPNGALDEILDIESVKAQTGCNNDDYQELCQVFISEGHNMIQRLTNAEKAILNAKDHFGLLDAADLVYASAHELSASFGIIGARSAEAYARETQSHVRYRTNRSDQQNIPPKDELLTATRTLMACVQGCLELLK